MRILTYVSNFDWETSFWKLTMGSQTIYTLGVKGKDGSQGIAQLWLVREILQVSLVMMDRDYWAIRIQISTETRDKLRAGLSTQGILKGAWNPTSLNTEISMSIKKDFVDSLVRIMSDDKCKANVDF